MVSSYLELPLRTLKQALEDRARAPSAGSVQPVNIAGSGSVELLLRLLTENTGQGGAIDPQPPLSRRRAA